MTTTNGGKEVKDNNLENAIECFFKGVIVGTLLTYALIEILGYK